MTQSQPNNPLHGVTLKAILEYLVAVYGWEQLGESIKVYCFQNEPSINSSLKFLRRTDWARTKVEQLYIESIRYDDQNAKPNLDADEPMIETSEVKYRARKI